MILPFLVVLAKSLEVTTDEWANHNESVVLFYAEWW